MDAFMTNLLTNDLNNINDSIRCAYPLLRTNRLTFDDARFFVSGTSALISGFNNLNHCLILIIVSFLIVRFCWLI